MVKECMAILTNMTEVQSKNLSNILSIPLEVSYDCMTMKPDAVHGIQEIISDENLDSNNVVNIDGILLPIHNKDHVQTSKLVPVKSTTNNLRSLALAVASGRIHEINTHSNFVCV